MKKLINNPENFVKDTMTGIIAAYGDKVKLLDGDERILVTNYPVAGWKSWNRYSGRKRTSSCVPGLCG